MGDGCDGDGWVVKKGGDRRAVFIILSLQREEERRRLHTLVTDSAGDD